MDLTYPQPRESLYCTELVMCTKLNAQYRSHFWSDADVYRAAILCFVCDTTMAAKKAKGKALTVLIHLGRGRLFRTGPKVESILIEGKPRRLSLDQLCIDLKTAWSDHVSGTFCT
jgi:hypothetical protein